MNLRVVETHELAAKRITADQPGQFRVSIEPGLSLADGCVNYKVALTCDILTAEDVLVAQLNAIVVGQYGIEQGQEIPESVFHEFGPIALQEIYVYARQQVYDLALRIGLTGFVLNDIGQELAAIAAT
ncbi:hypothetical protein OG689_11105 [Kitasatospora sp. NBC_00240]|uniref:hypothetical protein n=1 Tax=Kitasatospora sp. NBC_00240 TaxID=2903567 RepID=UPI00225125CF|nr:hypothetical protein [Kitasatospora sp. NBC_00240]MCX5209833.1 hypothetical protein [Kitasatospora sp. NBC_00240]